MVAVALHGDLGVKALFVHVAQAVADVGHDVEAAEGRELDELVEIALVEVEALLIALVLDVVKIRLAAQVVEGAEDEVVLRHVVDALGALGLVVALAELEAEGHKDALRGLLQCLDVLVGLLLGQREALGADLHGLGHAEVSVVGEADLGNAALL